MALFDEWDRLQKSPAYLKQSPEDKTFIKSQWFKEVVVPSDLFKKYTPEDQQFIESEFTKPDGVSYFDMPMTEVAARNLEDRNELTRGILRGTDSLQSSLYGFEGLIGSALGLEGVKKQGFEGYKRNIAEAEENPASVKFSDLSITEPLKANLFRL